MKCIYCAKCGTRLTLTRKALPKYGRIINLVKPHECPDEPVEFDLSPVDVPTFAEPVKEGDDKFVQNLNRLDVPHDLRVGPFQGDDGHIGNPGDRRDIADVKSETSSSAPRTLLDNMKAMHPTAPVHGIKDEPKEE